MIIKIAEEKDFEHLKELMQLYKHSIGELPMSSVQFERLKLAIINGNITFYIGTKSNDIMAMCSITVGFSSYLFESFGIFEDFYVKDQYRKTGVAKQLTDFVFEEMKKQSIHSVWVGCSDVDFDMYKHLGFNIQLGNLLAWSD